MRKKLVLIILLSALILAILLLPKFLVPSNSPKAYLESANEALKNNEFEDSVELFKEILDEDPSLAEARIGLANSYISLSHFDEAIETLNEGIDIQSNVPQFYYYLAKAYEGINDLPQVIQTLQDGIEITDNVALEELFEQLESNITIEVDRHFIQEGHSRNLILSWKKSDGTILPVKANWELHNGEYGTIEKVSDTIMSFHADDIGTVEISASVDSITKKAKIHIEEQVVEELKITPNKIDPLSIGQEIDIQVSGLDANGDEMEIHPEWTTNKKSIAKLSDTEGTKIRIKAIDEGIARITISYQELHKEFDVIIESDNRFVSVHVEGNGTVTRSPDKTSYISGSKVTLTATPEAGYEFVGWAGDITGSSNPIEITLNSSKSIQSIFQPMGYTLNLAISGEGIIIRDSLSNQYGVDETVPLLARPSSGWDFSHWEGSVSSNSSRIQVKMDQDKDIRAVFVKAIEYSNENSNDAETNTNNNINNNKDSNKEEKSRNNSSNKSTDNKQSVEQEKQNKRPLEENPTVEEKVEKEEESKTGSDTEEKQEDKQEETNKEQEDDDSSEENKTPPTDSETPNELDNETSE